ncbi:hypothetical protein BJF86_09550 [Serinicoccus sp. CNJ-927]|uniref:hypothetical protein n=1 Tax=Serinicoccus sp. CNJ-927 TaxID=1904970 RepID=UPI0009652AF4|nr:hypothetical protein [Serinicoccus sp. CNJ-927]OLT39247.1 hypothetical protein BJF86_09550 [Serinicoccus sp. CNJ-927]
MSELYAYPRLCDGPALVIHQQMLRLAEQPSVDFTPLVGYSHHDATPVPTGAPIANEDRIKSVRSAVVAAIEPWLSRQNTSLRPTDNAAFDLALGKTLCDSLQIMPADAGHKETWSFLSTVVFPDVVYARFPGLHVDRVLGRQHRNALRRAWFRFTIVGDLQLASSRPLGEDEMTALFERPTLAMNPRLLRLLAEHVLSSSASDRANYTRQLAKRAIALTGAYLLDVIPDFEIRELLGMKDLLTRKPDNPPSSKALLTSSWPRSSATHATPPLWSHGSHRVEHKDPPAAESTVMVQKVAAQESSDLVSVFHREMVQLCRQIEQALGTRPRELARRVATMGGFEAARQALASTSMDLFVALWEAGHSELSVEALVLDARFRGLFTAALLERAEQRLGVS